MPAHEPPSLGLRLLDGVLLQVGWFAAVLGAAQGHPWWGPGFVIVAVTLHLARSRVRWPAELRGLVVFAAIGLVHEHAQVASGVVRFQGTGPRWGAVPLWIVLLWPLFAATFGTLFRWLQGRPGRAALVGALGGPPGYLAAERLGALELPLGWGPAVLSLAVGWGLSLPLALAAMPGGAGRPAGEAA